MAKREYGKPKEKSAYRFYELPENIRQMGEQPEQKRVYIEDYVITYMHQIFQTKQQEAVVIFVGQKGEEQAKDCSFIYGAVGIELDLPEGTKAFTDDTWDEIYEKVCGSFPGAQVLGWGCGVSMWNSQIDKSVQMIQEKYFSQEEKVLFLEDLGEKEEKIYHWHNGKLVEMPGYVIYYDKNPLMQEYMLQGQPKKSFEAEYKDDVTADVRKVIQQKEEKEETKKFAFYSVTAAAILLAVLGANLLVQSNQKIESLEKTLETLSHATADVTSKPTEEDATTDVTSKPKEEGATTDVTSAPAEETQAAFLPDASVLPEQTVPPVLSKEQAAANSKADKSKATASSKSNKSKSEESKATASSKSDDSKTTANSKSEESKTTANTKSENVKKANAAASNQSYIVRSGDTLSQIVWRQYHDMQYMENVKKINHIKNEDEIKAGQLLVLP